jgi:periplasmic protein TonB
MKKLLAMLFLTGCAAVPTTDAVPKPSLVWPATCPSMPKFVSRVHPRVPPDAIRKQQSGWVILEFDVLGDGSPANVRVVDSSPKGLFENAVLSTVPKWKFEPNKPWQRCPFYVEFNVG